MAEGCACTERPPRHAGDVERIPNPSCPVHRAPASWGAASARLVRLHECLSAGPDLAGSGVAAGFPKRVIIVWDPANPECYSVVGNADDAVHVAIVHAVYSSTHPTRESLHALADWFDDPTVAPPLRFRVEGEFDPGYILRALADALPQPAEPARG